MASSTAVNDFRSTNRQSMFRANIFLVECIAVLAAYLCALHHHLGPIDLDHIFTGNSSRVQVLSAFGVIYMIRLNVMSRYLLRRELSIEELTIVVLIWLPSIMASFVLLSTDFDLHSAECAGIITLYLFGSCLNTLSELQRKIWKEGKHATFNKGRCYKGGLFSLSRNINYFGDTVLFGAWAAATGSYWNAWVPVVMSLSFWFYHIPDKEKYLAKRYGHDWDDYAKKTPYRFVPFVC